eukprot:4322323-Amphidinium_carterae.1
MPFCFIGVGGHGIKSRARGTLYAVRAGGFFRRALNFGRSSLELDACPLGVTRDWEDLELH